MTQPSHEVQLTSLEAAEQLRCSARSVTRYLTQGKFPHAWRTDRKWRVPQSDVDAFMRDRRPGLT